MNSSTIIGSCRRDIRACQRSPEEGPAETPATSGHDAEVTSGNDVIHEDTLQMAFTNRAVSMVTEDGAGYTSLEKEMELIGSQVKSEHPQPKPQSDVYEEIPDSSNIGHSEAGYNLPLSQYEGYDNAVDVHLPPSSGSYINQAVTKGTQDEHGYDYPQTQPDVYEEIPDSSTVGHKEAGYNPPLSQYGGYENAVDESRYIPPSSGRYINQAVTKGTEDEHGYDYPQIQPDMYEEIPDSFKD